MEFFVITFFFYCLSLCGFYNKVKFFFPFEKFPKVSIKDVQKKTIFDKELLFYILKKKKTKTHSILNLHLIINYVLVGKPALNQVIKGKKKKLTINIGR